jgi:hypothetical protein
MISSAMQAASRVINFQSQLTSPMTGKLMLPNLSANKEGRCLKLLRLAPASDGETTRVHIGPPDRSRLIILASLKDLCNSHH